MRSTAYCGLVATLLCPLLAAPAAHAQDGSGKVIGSTHYDTVDCNAIATRQTMLREYNERLPSAASLKVIDVLDQKKLSGDAKSITCYGTYSFSDGTTKRITYKEMVNSLGQTVWTFIPDSW